MQFSILLLPILGGAIYCRTSFRFRYRFYRRRGYELFFTAATSGALLLAGSFLLVYILTSIEYLRPVECFWSEVTPDIQWLGTCALPIVLAIPTAHLVDGIDQWIAGKTRDTWIYNKWWWPFSTDSDMRLKELDEFGTELELLAYEAVEVLQKVVSESEKKENGSDSPVAPKYLVTLESGKVFIGIISSAPDPIGKFSYLKMIKLASGYRTERHKVSIETRYDKYFPDGRENADGHEERESGRDEIQDRKLSLKPADFEVTISVDEIVHLTPFDITVDGPEDWPMT